MKKFRIPLPKKTEKVFRDRSKYNRKIKHPARGIE